MMLVHESPQRRPMLKLKKTRNLSLFSDTTQHSEPVFYVLRSQLEVENALRVLYQAEIEMQQFSLIGKANQSEQQALGFFTAGERIRIWGGAGAFWRLVWGWLASPAVFFLPGMGLLAMAGPLVGKLLAAMEAAGAKGEIGALADTLEEIGFSSTQINQYQAALQGHQYVLMLHGNSSDAVRGLSLIHI
jgi:hypothetical protein